MKTWTRGETLSADDLNENFGYLESRVDGIGATQPDVVNVKAFGAKGDGTTDDTNAIISAAVAAAGSVLYLPAGNYRISAPINLLSNTVVEANNATITAAPKAAWGAQGVTHAFYATNQSNIVIDGLDVSFPLGWGNFGGGEAAHILAFTGCTNVNIRNCVSNGGSNQTAFVGCTNVQTINCQAFNVANCAFDHWAGTVDAQVIGCYASTIPTDTHSGMSCINFTGIGNGLGPANNAGFLCIGNICYLGNSNAQGISINGHSTGGTDDKVIIANNKVVLVGSASNSWGILVVGHANNVHVHHNYIEGNGLNNIGAIGAFTPATGVRIDHNIAVNWVAGTNRIFANTSDGGSLLYNVGYGCSSPLVGPLGATVQSAGNDSGTGVIPLANVSISSGSGAFTNLSSINSPVFGWNGAGGVVALINGAAGYPEGLQWQTAGVRHWQIITDGSAQSGGNAGDNLVIAPYADTTGAGFGFGAALTFTRATGAAKFGGNVGFNNTNPIARPTVSGSRGGNAALASVLTALASYGLITDSSTA